MVFIPDKDVGSTSSNPPPAPVRRNDYKAAGSTPTFHSKATISTEGVLRSHSKTSDTTTISSTGREPLDLPKIAETTANLLASNAGSTSSNPPAPVRRNDSKATGRTPTFPSKATISTERVLRSHSKASDTTPISSTGRVPLELPKTGEITANLLANTSEPTIVQNSRKTGVDPQTQTQSEQQQTAVTRAASIRSLLLRVTEAENKCDQNYEIMKRQIKTNRNSTKKLLMEIRTGVKELL